LCSYAFNKKSRDRVADVGLCEAGSSDRFRAQWRSSLTTDLGRISATGELVPNGLAAGTTQKRAFRAVVAFPETCRSFIRLFGRFSAVRREIDWRGVAQRRQSVPRETALERIFRRTHCSNCGVGYRHTTPPQFHFVSTSLHEINEPDG